MLLQQPSPSPKTLPNPFLSHVHLPRNLLPRTPYHFRRNSFLLHASASSADTKSLPQSAIRRIADKLRSLGYVEDNSNKQQPSPPEETLVTSPGEIFVPLPNRIPKYRVGHTLDPSWSTPENPVPEPGSGNAIRRYHELRREVWKEKKEEKAKRSVDGDTESENVPTMAELKLPPAELRRLRGLGIAIKQKLKIGKAGITEGIVNGIHERWRRTELVKIICEDMCRLNMRRTHDLLERKTGGLVVWRSGSIIILYRGSDYKYPYFFVHNTKPSDASVGESTSSEDGGVQESYSSGLNDIDETRTGEPPLIQGVGSRTRVRFQLPGETQLVEEADQLLHGLGPRFTDWYGYDPLPVDADLLPAIVPGYRKPFRLLPFGVQPKLTNDEMTILRRLGRPLPCHFALGRNRKHQGLAAAILKLWEKCEIAKIAVKRGVQNTNSELMAKELQWLTGGTLLTRDKEYIVLYRGKDFLPATVSSAIEQRRNNHGLDGIQRNKTPNSSTAQLNEEDKGTETSSASENGGMNDQKLEIAIEQRKQRSREAAIKRNTSKLSQALVSKEKAEKLLEELEKEETKQQLEIDKEGITEEERYMLRKVGLKMRPFLLLGRRGVFDGTVENMHLHWKYRELVKILSGESSIDELHATARTLEAESGGILVAVERVRKGHAIIVYRGKNYKRPPSLRPQTLLNKREALKRSIEAQRRESLKLHVLKLGKNVEELKLKLAKNEEIGVHGEKDQNMQLEQEQEMERSPLAEYMEPNTNIDLRNSNSTNQENGQRKEVHESEGDSFFSNKNGGLQESSETDCEDQSQELSAAQTQQCQNLQKVSSIKDADKEQEMEMEVSPSAKYVEPNNTNTESTNQENEQEREVHEEDLHFSIKNDDGLQASPQESPETNFDEVSSSKHDESEFTEANNSKASSSSSTLVKLTNKSEFRVTESTGKRHRSGLLSNKERLLLRKQALKMTKRPVLAVGRSNIVSGVTKTIKTHFQKHPLAIVNIKGRAKGTSVQEVVSKLEEATGAILVSQEPNKVILYRGWGAIITTTRDHKQINEDEGVVKKTIISPELISAIRFECGLEGNIAHEPEGVS